MNFFFDQPPLAVLAHFAPHTRGLTWHRAPLGFSGATVWRGDDPDGAPRVALKAWPEGVSAERARYVHALMREAAHLEFVPTVFASRGGDSTVEEGGRVWDTCRWMLGAARVAPSAEDVGRACEAVARLHTAWASDTQRGPCPGVLTRLRVLSDNAALLRAGPDALPPVAPELNPLLREAVKVVARHAPCLTAELGAWRQIPLALHPVVRDLRGEHVLFEGACVSGLVDYGAAAVDHPAVDLARVLGDLACGNEALWAAGLARYRAVRGAFDVPDELVRVLARAGAVCSLLGWVVRLVVRREPPGSPVAVAARMRALFAQVQSFQGVEAAPPA